MANATDQTFDVQGMFNKAIIGILISKEVITEREVLVILENINKQQDTHYEKQNKLSQ